MSHGLTKDDKMAWRTLVPWHGLGANVDDLIESGELRTVADAARRYLDWKVSVRPMYFPDVLPEGFHDLPSKERWKAWLRFEEQGEFGLSRDEKRAIVRDDTLKRLAFCGSQYTVVQNIAGAEFLDDLVGVAHEMDFGELGPQDVKFETCGSLEGGERVWFLARIGEDIAVRRLDGSEDTIVKYMLVVLYHNGAGSVQVMATPIRVVCANTLAMALSDAENVYRMKHTPNIEDKLEDCKNALRVEVNYYQALKTVAQELEEKRVSAQQNRDFVASLIAGTERILDYDKAMERMGKKRAEAAEEEIQAMEHLFRDGKGNHGETAWDSLQSVAEYVDHHKKRMRRGRDLQQRLSEKMDDVIFGTGAKRKQKALNLLTRW